MEPRKNTIIGTAGHVDHGKTSLIQALTGIDTDRLEEEKKRGITIELGFAWLGLPNGQRVGIIDVPGHERFIKNMFAGAGGIDLALLVIAADEGIMPQTLEHLSILTLLKIPRGIIVLTKCDLVENDWLELVEEEIREKFKETLMEKAPILKVSAQTKEGIEDLRSCIYDELLFCEPKPVDTALKIPIDRIFTMDGFGTVVTGTVIEGKIKAGEEVMLYPSKTMLKVRTLQVHSQKMKEAVAGQRVAVNLSGVKKEAIKRGNVLASPESLPVTKKIDVRLNALLAGERSIKNNSRVHFYCGAMETIGKVILLDRDLLEAGEETYAQLRFEEEIPIKAKEPFVIRFYSPMETIGGGVVINPFPKKHKRGDEKVMASLETLLTGDDRQRFLEALTLESFRPLEAIRIQMNIKPDVFKEIVKEEAKKETLVMINASLALHQDHLNTFFKQLCTLLEKYHQDYPLRQGMTREEMRSKLLSKQEISVVNAMLTHLSEELSYEEGYLKLKNFKPIYTAQQEKLKQDLEKRYDEGGFSPPKLDDLDPNLLKNKQFKPVMEAMISEGTLIALDPKICFLGKNMVLAEKVFQQIEKEFGSVLLAQFRDALETSRKHAVAVLEYWDARGLTKKMDDARKSTKLMRNEE